jgi:seryl-tRNA synthetase
MDIKSKLSLEHKTTLDLTSKYQHLQNELSQSCTQVKILETENKSIKLLLEQSKEDMVQIIDKLKNEIDEKQNQMNSSIKAFQNLETLTKDTVNSKNLQISQVLLSLFHSFNFNYGKF